MYRKVLVASDPEGLAEQAVPIVASLVRGTGAEVQVVAVDIAVATPEVRRDVATHMNRVVDGLQRADVSARGVVRFSHRDHIADQLASAASEWGADLIVLGSHRRGDLRSVLVGSVGHALARRIRTPLLFVGSEGGVRNPDLPPAGRRSVLVPIDQGPGSQQAIETAIGISGPETRVHILHVMALPPAALIEGYVTAEVIEADREEGRRLIDAALQKFADHGIHATGELVEPPGEVARQIVRVADDHGADVIVLGSRRLATAWALVAGSVAHAVIASTRRSVLLAGPQTPLPS